MLRAELKMFSDQIAPKRALNEIGDAAGKSPIRNAAATGPRSCITSLATAGYAFDVIVHLVTQSKAGIRVSSVLLVNIVRAACRAQMPRNE
jgi:hypothetical protein